MTRVLEWFQTFAMAIGGPGLFVVAFLDSSLLSLPEVNDVLIIWMVTQQPHRMVYYATMATLGSVAGCLVLYYLARKGGEAILRGRFHERHVNRAMDLIRRYGGLALLVPALLPPPAPFKVFVLMAGVAAVPIRTFVAAIVVGRGVRYFGEGLLAVWWGEQALEYVRRNGETVGLILAGLVLVGGVGYVAWRSRTRPAL
jgi:membrane protein YqaA with SNARE-associated domain